MTPHSAPQYVPPPTLSRADQGVLGDLCARGTPANTLRAYERDLVYITAWRLVRFGAPPCWPEIEAVALAFVQDHARDLNDAPPGDRSRQVAETLIAQGLRRSLACPAPSTLDRRIASWRAFHRIKTLASPFDAPLVRQARGKARRAAARPPAPKSAHPITRPVLEAMLATCRGSARDDRDRAMLMLGWASGGRRRAEIVALMRADLALTGFASTGQIWMQIGAPPRLVLKGRAAQALVHWIETAGIDDGPVFRPVSKSGRPLPRRLSPDAVYQIVRHRLTLAGYPPDFATPHGLRSGFLTQAALDGAPIQAAMRLSRHRSLAQVLRYFDDVDMAENPAADLLG